MRKILELLDEYTDLDKNLTDSQVIAIYEATTEEEKIEYMQTIQNLLEHSIIPDNFHDLIIAVSFLNLQNIVLQMRIDLI